MTYYHQSKQAAIEAGEQAALEDPRVLYAKPEFEPGNGWVAVLVPKPVDIMDLSDRFEIRYEGRAVSKPPATKKRYAMERATPLKPAAKVAEEILVAAPGEILVRPPWEVFDGVAELPDEVQDGAVKPWE